VPNLAIATAIVEHTKEARLSYLGSHQGPEKDLVTRAGIHFESISTGKLRRYFDLKNFLDIIRFPLGIVQAWWKLGRLKPDAIFSKGGFVGVPVVLAGWLRRIPVVIHESDANAGLATKLTARFAKKIFLGYKCDLKGKVVGNPVRNSLLKGSANKAKKFTGFTGKKPVLLVMGGSSGAASLNQKIKNELTQLTEKYDVLHITGKGKGKRVKRKNYVALPYVHDELADIYELTDCAITRAGAGALAELQLLNIPSLMYPLGRHVSRGDQWLNAKAQLKRSKLFHLENESKSVMEQLKVLPKRPKSRQKNTAATSIATYLLGL
jgi:UDP-N-acetylglucosamine--N-acetylmuramyl-(pentapeptide) pyrophosphoryl-undecaprenol N-acetylglucosamine transferase